MRGIYTLIIAVGKTKTISVGALGRIRFSAGIYLYIGSGLGKYTSSIEGRIERHLGLRHRNRWHIDYLLSSKGVTLTEVTYAETNHDEECRLAQHLLSTLPIEGVYPHFGSSDCNCKSHLLFLSGIGVADVVSLVKRCYHDTGLKFKRMS